ncbi:MAG: DUF2283 domain-containing protein [Thermoguttaceae bacterium]
MKANSFSFRVNIETEGETGEVLAVYIQFREGKSAKVKEYEDGKVFADYDKHGTLIGIEILAPCRAEVLYKIAMPARARRFVRDTVPKRMLSVA